MFRLLLVLCISFLSFSCYSQGYYMDTIMNENEFDKILLLKQQGNKESYVIPKFEKALILYNSYSYYIDQINKYVYFLCSVIESLGVNGKINIRYYLEKYSIVKSTVVYETNFSKTNSKDNNTQYSLNDDGYVFIKASDNKITRVDLRKLNPTTKWWD